MMKHKLSTRLLSLLLVMAMFLQSIPLHSLAATEESTEVFSPSNIPTAEVFSVAENDAEDLTSPPTIVGEEESRRSENTKHFRLSDGTYLSVGYGMPVHYLDEKGVWRDIINTPTQILDASGLESYQILNKDTSINFASSTSNGKLLTATYQDTSVSMTLLDTVHADELQTDLNAETTATIHLRTSSEDLMTYNREVRVELENATETKSDTEAVKTGWCTEELIPEDLNTTLTYEEVFPGIDFRYTVSGFNIKEEIIVKQKRNTYRYDFLLETQGLSAHLNDDGSIFLVNDDKEIIYSIPTPFMTDATGILSEDVVYTLTKTERGIVLTVEADAEWLNSNDRKFPVVIDPTLINQSSQTGTYIQNADLYLAYVSSGYPDSKYNRSSNLYTGYQSGADKSYEAFVHFNNLPELPAGSIVTEAYLELYQIGYSHMACSKMPMGIYEATVGANQNYFSWFDSMTWNNRPGYHSGNLIDYAMVSAATSYDYVCWNITELVKKWYTQPTSERTIVLAPVGTYSSTKCAVPVYRAYNDTSGLPLFVVGYRSKIGVEPYYTYRILSAGAAGTAHISDDTGQLTVAKQVTTMASAINPFALSMVYNSNNFAKNANASDDIQTNYGIDMRFGTGFKLDIIQTVEEVSITGYDYLLQRDADGTIHYFLKNTDGKFYDEDGLGLTAVKTGNTYTISDNVGNTRKYEAGFLTEISDETGSKICLEYNSGDNGSWFNDIRQVNAGQESIRVAKINYGTNSYVSSITDYAEKTYNFIYDSAGHLIEIKRGSTIIAQYSYSGNRLISMEDCESDYMLRFAYDSAGRVSSYSEWTGYSTSDPSGARVEITYGSDQTCFRDCGTDRVAETMDDILTYVSFDYVGRTVNTYTTDSAGIILGAANAAYYSASQTTDARKNHITSSAAVGIPAQHLLHNGGFESTGSYVWSLSKQSSASTIEISQNDSHTGSHALKGAIPSGSVDSLVATRSSMTLTAGKTYTFSGYIKTSDLQVSSNGGVYLRVKDSNGIVKYSPTIQYSTSQTAGNGWVRLSLTFTARETGSHTMQVVSFGSTGTWYADDLQLELGEAPSERNLLENGSMSIDDAFWTLGTNAICTSSGSSKFIQITGSPTDPISTDSGVGSAWQNVPIHLPATETFVMSGWAKGNAVPDNVTDPNAASGNDRNKSFGLRAIVTYSDNSASYHYVPFNPDLGDWQYVSTTIVAPEGKENLEIVNICVVCAYETNGNTMIFDDLSLVQEAAQTMKYDEDGNLVKISTTGVDPDINTYDNNGNLTKMTTGDGSKLENTYDSTFVHRLITAKDTGTGLTQTLGYDDFGNVTTITVTSANGSKIKTALDYSADGNRLESVTDAVGNTVRYTYNGAKSIMMGLPTSITDGKGIVTTMQYDDFGRTAQTSVANGGIVQYTYDKGMLDTISTHSQTYDFDYDVWGNMTRAEVGSWILGDYTYGDKNGQLTKQAFANDDFVSYTYDDLGRTRTVTWSDGRILHYAYTGDGQLYSISDSITGKTQYYHYDGLGRLVNSYQVSTEYTEGEKPIRSDYTYNADGRLTRREYYTPTTGKAYMTYTCDANAQNAVTNGLLTSLRMVNGQSIGYGYDSLQRLLDKGVSGGFWEQYAYAPGSQSGTTSTQVSGLTNWMGSTMLHTFTYGYDGNGNITSINDGKKGTSVAYTYDVQNQLTKAVHSNGRTESYTYDTAGNILTFSNGTNSHTYTYGDTYGWKDLLTKVDGQSITYDNSGNPISYYDGYRYTMEWTEGRKLAKITYNNQDTTYEYNHEGLRTKQTYRDGSYILYDIVDGVYVGETRYNANGSVSVYIRYILDEDNSPVGISLWYPNSTSWTDYHFIKNLQGDVLEVYKTSDNSLAASYTYDSWGNILSKSGSLATINPFRYRSYYFDEQTWFYYLQSRYYDPAIGRFINADVYVSTGQGVLGNNMFAYCGNNPIVRADASGYFFFTILGAAIGGATGYVDALIMGTDPETGFKAGLVSGAIAGAGVDVGVLVTAGTGGAGIGAGVAIAGAFGAVGSVVGTGISTDWQASSAEYMGSAIVGAGMNMISFGLAPINGEIPKAGAKYMVDMLMYEGQRCLADNIVAGSAVAVATTWIIRVGSSPQPDNASKATVNMVY